VQVGDGHWASGEDEEEDDREEELEPEDSQDECIQGGDMLENDEFTVYFTLSDN
jgi:hypothetical protein